MANMKHLFASIAILRFALPLFAVGQPQPDYAPPLSSLASPGAKLFPAAAPDGGDALVFDGKSKDGVKLPVPDTFLKSFSGEEVSGSFWFRMDAPSEADIALGFFTCPSYRETAPVQFKLKTRQTDFGVVSVSSLIEHRVVTGVWHHAAFAFSLGKMRCSTFFDGQAEAIRDIEADVPSPIDPASLFAAIGARGFVGTIASIRLWNRVLGRDELLEFNPSATESTRLEGVFRNAPATGNKAFDSALSQIADKLRDKSAGLCSVREWQTASRVARDLPSLAALAEASGRAGTLADAPFAASTFYEYGSAKHLPYELPADANPVSSIKVALAKGEYEAATFMLHPLRDVAKLDVAATALESGGRKLPADALDIRVVKCWYAPLGGWNTYFGGNRESPVLIPELLLHDDTLVVVDTEERANLLRVNYAAGARYVNVSRPGIMSKSSSFNYVTSPVADTPGPMPANVSLRFGEWRQFWVTVHPPADAAPGTYSARISFTADGHPAGEIPVSVEVRPYELPVARTRYDLSREYLGGMMNHCHIENQVSIGHSLEVAERRFLAEMRNLVAHNIRHPFSPSFNDEDPVKDLIAERQYRLMREAGCSTDLIFGGGSACEVTWAASEGITPEKNPDLYEKFLERYDRRVRHAAKKADELFGHRNFLFCGIDEAGPATVREEFRFFDVLHKYGFGVFLTSGRAAYANFAVDVDDIPAYISDSEAARWHAAGARAVSYAAPFTGPENPEPWRRNKGLRMYLANYDGLAEYVLYEGFNIWNEFITPSIYKNFNIVYPTADGLIDTVAWEALREGFDDIRYATLLKQLGEIAMKSSDAAVAALGRKGIFWLETLDAETVDLRAYRSEAADFISRLLNAGVTPPQEPQRPSCGSLRPAAEVFRRPDSELNSFGALVAEAAKLRKYGFHDLAVPLLKRAASDFPDAGEGDVAAASLDLAESLRLLLDDAGAANVFRSLVTGKHADPAICGKAYAGLMKITIVPSEYEWSPTTQALDRAQALYDEAFSDRRIAVKDKKALVGIMAPAFIRGGRAEKLAAICDEWLKPGPTGKKEVDSTILEHQGDAYAALGRHGMAVSRYSLIALSYTNRLRILEKIGENARKAKDFRKAQQAYSDMIQFIDKEEDKGRYKRVSAIIVSLTKATQKATKNEAASVLDNGGQDFSDLNLDE